eukprot:TRINITY_DN1253_c0_g1_i2.p2 TRINITY_DN1253_c0_g1~~TRINITY_DN1253_c0_g1_i2.p2  ORF type:complete len:200 (+),score=0.86 TRINITY_DN1253_c0_g1_i2:1709-2308(+)
MIQMKNKERTTLNLNRIYNHTCQRIQNWQFLKQQIVVIIAYIFYIILKSILKKSQQIVIPFLNNLKFSRNLSQHTNTHLVYINLKIIKFFFNLSDQQSKFLSKTYFKIKKKKKRINFQLRLNFDSVKQTKNLKLEFEFFALQQQYKQKIKFYQSIYKNYKYLTSPNKNQRKKVEKINPESYLQIQRTNPKNPEKKLLTP